MAHRASRFPIAALAAAAWVALLGSAAAETLVVTEPLTIADDDFTYEGFDVIVQGPGGVLTIDGSHAFASLILEDGAVVRHDPAAGLDLTLSGDLSIDASSALDVSALGYPAATGPGAGSEGVLWASGGGHGGAGGDAAYGDVPGGGTYGSAGMPQTLGSGGGNAGDLEGGAGGGQVALQVDGTLLVDGVLLANGGDGDSGPASNNYRTGGGAGGSILIHCAHLAGEGMISADGGNAIAGAGGGGGGRIAIYSPDLGIPASQITVSGGTGWDAGDPGSVYLGSVYVQPDGSGDYPTIQAAADSVPDLTIILLADGVFTGEGNRDIDPHGKDLLFRSVSGDPTACVIDCQGSADDQHRGFFIHSGETASTMIADITITNGFVAGRDGEGGGVYVGPGSAALVDGVIFKANSSSSGGGGLHYDPESAGKVASAIFEFNVSGSGGGGLHYRDGTQGLAINCVFIGNESGGDAAAINLDAGTQVGLQSCTVVGNSGNAIYVGDFATVDIEQTIVAFNTGTAVVCGDGITLTMVCSDVFGNAGGDFTGCIEGYDGDGGPFGSDNISLDPLFADWPNGDLTLLPGSPCLPENSPCGLLIGAEITQVARTAAPGTSATPDSRPATSRVELGQNFPNPFNPSTSIAFRVPRPGPVFLAVYDLEGRLVATLVDEVVSAGEHTAIWTGTDTHGRSVASGTYLYRLRTVQQTLTGVLTLVK